MKVIHENIRFVQSKIAEASIRSGRSEKAVNLLIVSKTFAPDLVQEAVDFGHDLFGENRVQELLAKKPLLPSHLKWQLIGHLQSNKVRKILPHVEVIQGVDSLDIARDIQRIAPEFGLYPKVYLEVNVAAEVSKFGFAPETLEQTLEQLLALDRLEIQGLMCIPPIGKTAEDSRRYFAKLREIRDRLEHQSGIDLPDLSMGMSGDYEVAVEEGATLVRVGSAIFGPRLS